MIILKREREGWDTVGVQKGQRTLSWLLSEVFTIREATTKLRPERRDPDGRIR
jgi:hypothetical protein